MINRNRTSGKITAVVLSILIGITCVPSFVFAAPGEDGQSVAELKQAMDEAESEMNEAKNAMTEKEEVVQQYQEALNNAQAAADEANDALTEAQNAEAEAQTARDTAFNQAKTDATNAYNNAAAAYTLAEQEYNDAVDAADSKAQELQDARGTKQGLENDISTLTQERDAAQQQVDSLPAEISAAQQDVDTATTQWNQAKEDADQAVSDAQTAMNSAGRGFINKMINDNGGNDLDYMIAACKTYSNANINTITDSSGNSYSTVADVANSENFEKVVDRACTYENLKKNVEYIKESNVHRNLSIHNAGDLKVSYQLMGTAIISNSISVFQTGHNLTKGDTQWNFWKSGNSTTSGENLAYSRASSEGGWDPFHGWYYEERMRAISNDNGIPNNQPVSQEIVDQVLQESVNNGFPYDPYSAPWFQSRDEFRNGISSVVGHYESVINHKFKATGFSYIDGVDYALTNFPYVASQEFNGDTTKSVTVEQYEQELDEWFEGYLNNLEAAEANKQDLETKPANLVAAEETLQQKQDALETARQTVNTKQGQIDAKNAELGTVNANITTLEGELETANQTKDAKEQAKNQAATAKENKMQAKQKADALDTEDPATYEDFDELKNLAEAYNNAKTTTAQKSSEADEAAATVNTAQGPYDAAKDQYEASVKAYNDAKDKYEQAKATYEEQSRIKAPVGKTFTYDGKTKNGVAAGANYTLSGTTEAANAGSYEATATLEKGYFWTDGTTDPKIITWKINKAANPLTIKGKTAKLKYKKLKKKAQTVDVAKVIAFTKKGLGKMNYLIVSAKKGTKNFKKKIKINASTGKVSVKKGLKKGTYVIKAKAKAVGNANYNASAWKTVSFKIKVK